MRLMSDDDIQPVDKYIKFRDSPESWLAEMKEFNLTSEEIEVVKSHLSDVNGVSGTQEEIMLLSMDERIAGFSISEANVLRKAVASINEKLLAKVKENFFEKGAKLGTSNNLLSYIWDKQIMMQAGYGFSQLHSMSYSLIALQSMNLVKNYPPIYWSTACLTVNSGAVDSTSEKTTDYGKIGVAIGDMQQRGVIIETPCINKSNYQFKPNAENNTVLFGLRGINGIGDNTSHAIIEHRPYKSFDDFIERLVDTKIISNVHMINLIKSGAFKMFFEDEYGEKHKRVALERYLRHTFEPRKSLNLGSFNTVIQLGVIPEKFSINVRFFNYRKHVMKNVVGRSPDRKTKNRIFGLDEVSTEFYFEHFTEEGIAEVNDDGTISILENIFDKEYQDKMEDVREWLASEQTLEEVNKALFKLEWDKHAQGSDSSWEMQTLSYYYSGHELKGVDRKLYDISNFFQLPEDGIIAKSKEIPQYVNGQKAGTRTFNEYQLTRIAGTVLDKDKNKRSIELLTPDGVVTVKMYGGMYSKFDRQISKPNKDGTRTVIEGSWFKRGTKLLLTGYRRQNQFIPRVYRDSIYQYTIAKIDKVKENGELSLSISRKG